MGRKLKKLRTRDEAQDAMLRQVRQFAALQDLRISVGNQMKAMVRQEIISEDELEGMFDESLNAFESAEKIASKAMVKYLPGIPIWEQWLKHVRGMGDVLAAQLVAMVQPIGDFDTPSKLWAYACGVPGDDGRVGLKKGEQPHHNTALKVVCYLIGEAFIKSPPRKEGQVSYREFYDRYKARDAEKHAAEMVQFLADKKTGKAVGGGRWSDLHMNTRARRYAYKMFLSHLWQVMREIEGLPIRVPYVIEQLGHTGYVSPWAMIEVPKKKGKAAATQGKQEPVPV